MLYDLALKMNCRWETIRNAMAADPRIGSSHLNPIHNTGESGGEVRQRLNFNDLHLEPVHKGGRGAGGHCFIKDLAAFTQLYKEIAGDQEGLEVLASVKNKNIDLLISSKKDLDLLAGVYGEKVIKDNVQRSLSYIFPQVQEKKRAKCLVTGGAGFIGSNLVDELITRGNEVIVIDDLSTGKLANVHPNARFFKADIRDLEQIKPLFFGVDYVFHLAARPRVQPSTQDPVGSHEVNLSGTLNVLVAARDAKVKKVIYSASSSVYGNQETMPLHEKLPVKPMSPYAMQKYMGEKYCRLFSELYGLPTVCLRYFNVYGQRQALEGAYSLVIGIFLNQRLNNQPMTITGDGEQRRDFTNVKDAARANILAANSQDVGQGEVINIGHGRNHSVNEMADMIGGSRIYIEPRLEPRVTLADNSLAKELLGWEPSVNLADWIKEYKKEIGLE